MEMWSTYSESMNDWYEGDNDVQEGDLPPPQRQREEIVLNGFNNEESSLQSEQDRLLDNSYLTNIQLLNPTTASA